MQREFCLFDKIIYIAVIGYPDYPYHEWRSAEFAGPPGIFPGGLFCYYNQSNPLWI